jgi:CheY-like chemotaxis protein
MRNAHQDLESEQDASSSVAALADQDLSQLLTAAQALAVHLRTQADKPTEVLELAAQLERTTNRALSVLQQARHLSHQLHHKRSLIHLSALAENAVQTLQKIAGTQIAVCLQGSSNVPAVLSTPQDLLLLLLLLGLRSIEAIRPNPGTVSILIEPVHFTSEDSQRLPGTQPGPYTRIVIRDTGSALETELVQRSLSPLPNNSIDPAPVGAILHAIQHLVSSHGGTLEVDCGDQGGTVTQVYLPAHEPKGLANIIPPGIPTGSGQPVLFVDDDPDLAQAASHLLPLLGYSPLVYTSPDEAIKALTIDPQLCQVAIVDLNMPQLTGIDLATQILEINPSIPVYVVTGMRGDWTPEMARNLGIRGVLHKPLTPAMWCLTLNEALQSSAPAL